MTSFPTDSIIELTYLIATALFVMSLKWMSSPTTARHGVWAGEAGMLLAIVGTLLNRSIVDYKWVAIALVLGMLTLVAGPIPQMRVQLWTALAAGGAFGLITAVLVRLAVQARRNKGLIGPEALLGAVGVAQQPIAPQGQILVHGELWLAESPSPVAAGEPVRVRAVEGLTLLVEPVHERVSA